MIDVQNRPSHPSSTPFSSSSSSFSGLPLFSLLLCLKNYLSSKFLSEFKQLPKTCTVGHSHRETRFSKVPHPHPTPSSMQ